MALDEDKLLNRRMKAFEKFLVTDSVKANKPSMDKAAEQVPKVDRSGKIIKAQK